MTVILLGWILASIGVQSLLNWISRKKNYGYGTKREVLAIILNAGIWSILYLKRMHPFIESGMWFQWSTLLLALVVTILISITFIDFKYYEIPNSYNAVIALLGIICILQIPKLEELWLHYVLGGVIAFVAFFILAIFTGGNLGMGDVKLAGGLGFFLGKGLLVDFFVITFLSGACISLILLLLKLKKKDDKIAFGPYICLAFIWLLVS